MPTYVYECEICGYKYEKFQPISADIKEYLWNYSYGKFNMPQVPTSTIEKD